MTVPPPLSRSATATTATWASPPASSSVTMSIDHVCSTNASNPGAAGSVIAWRVRPSSLSRMVRRPSRSNTVDPTMMARTTRGKPQRQRVAGLGMGGNDAPCRFRFSTSRTVSSAPVGPPGPRGLSKSVTRPPGRALPPRSPRPPRQAPGPKSPRRQPPSGAPRCWRCRRREPPGLGTANPRGGKSGHCPA